MLAIEEELKQARANGDFSTRQDRILYGLAEIQINMLSALREIVTLQQGIIDEMKKLQLHVLGKDLYATGGVVPTSEPYLVGSQSRDAADGLPRPKVRQQISKDKGRP